MKKVCMIAHRGYSYAYPENTALAFEKAAEHLSGGAETDVRVTRDGVLVCSHNSAAVLKDGTELPICEATYAELTAQPLKNLKTEDEVYLCTFERYLEIMREHDMICFIELKGLFTDEQEKQVMDTIKRVYDVSRCILQSFQCDNLLRIHAAYPELRLMLTYGARQRDEGGYECCFAHGVSIDADQYVLTEKLIEDFHAHGLDVAVWTCNTRESLERVLAMGVDFIESDVFGGAANE